MISTYVQSWIKEINYISLSDLPRTVEGYDNSSPQVYPPTVYGMGATTFEYH